MRRSVSREAYLVDDEPRMVFLTRYEQRFTNDDVLGYCSMRLFALSIRTTLAWSVRSRRHHGTRFNHVWRIHSGRPYPNLSLSGPGTAIDCPILIIVYKALGP